MLPPPPLDSPADLARCLQKMAKWMSIYLLDALERLAPLVEGVELTVKDLFNVRLLPFLPFFAPY